MRYLIPNHTINRLIVILIGLLYILTTPLIEAADPINDASSEDIDFMAEKPDEIDVGETAKTKGPDIFGVLCNTHWDIALRYVTH